MSTMSVDEVRKNLTDGLAELDACANGPNAFDTVLAWGNHLGVLFRNGKGIAIHITKATAVDPLTVQSLPKVTNGAGEQAYPTKRGEVATAQAKELRKILAERFTSN